MSVRPEDLARPFDFADRVSHFKWALAAADTHRCVGLELWREERPAVLMVYIEGVDSVSHLFGHLHRTADLGGALADDQRRFGRAVEQIYVYADRLVGEYLDAAGDATLLVLSDHGFRLGVLPDDPGTTRDAGRASDEPHTMDGILYLHGPAVRPGYRIENASILDVAPTILALAGVPAGEDMAGRVLSGALRIGTPPRVRSHEAGASGPSPVARRDERADPRALERLRSLGYIGAASPSGDANLAAMHFEAGRYEAALEGYRRLVAQDPRNAALRASLAGVLGALGRYDEALEELSVSLTLQPLNVEALHNRAAIHERRGATAAAIEGYREALRYDPQYVPSRRALDRLGVPPRPAGPRSSAEARAIALAEQAAGAARRGRHDEAMRLLDSALALAPRLALIHQYRSNVAYLAGDREAAIAALRKGLEIEPDNALFRENLRRLQRPHAGRPH
jgi:tetratricopeptide (TPR) repeat protein